MADKKEKHEHGEHCDHEHGDAEEQRRMIEAQIIQQQIMEIENQLNQIEAKRQELQSVVESIDSLKSSKDAEIKVPLGVGVLVNAKLGNTDEFFVNVGSNLVVRKNAEETKQLVEEQICELEKAKELFQNELERMLKFY